MKKNIKGKIYNTATAKFIGRRSIGRYLEDMDWFSESLYRKKTGEFFLYGEGNPKSIYAKSIGNYCWAYGQKIIPMTYDVAKNWAKEHLTEDAYESIFGAVVEDDTHKLVTLSMSMAAIEKAKRAASQAGMSLSAYIEKSVNTVSVVHGKWIDEDYPDRLATEESCIAICSVCGDHAIGFSDIDGCKQHIFTKFCPHCGAKMDLTE